ncbi:MAG: hypothetical protein Q9165_001359 [Trypethelium subeluteriae]
MLAKAQSTASPTFSCPANSGQLVTDTSGVQWLLGCGNDTSGGAQASGPGNSFDDCFPLCDNKPGCNAWAFVGGPNGVGAGNCYLKINDISPSLIAGSPNTIGAVLYTPTTLATSTSPAISASSAAGPQYVIVTVTAPASMVTATSTQQNTATTTATSTQQTIIVSTAPAGTVTATATATSIQATIVVSTAPGGTVTATSTQQATVTATATISDVLTATATATQLTTTTTTVPKMTDI